jgi:predicted nucleic acid-binding protein
VALSYVLDTSVVARLRESKVAARVRALDATGLARASVTDLEIGYSARNEREWDELHQALNTFALIEVEAVHIRRAGRVQRALAARGLRGRKVPDLLVAAAAEAHGLTVLHYDADFDHIATVTAQPTEWVVPAGSVD